MFGSHALNKNSKSTDLSIRTIQTPYLYASERDTCMFNKNILWRVMYVLSQVIYAAQIGKTNCALPY